MASATTGMPHINEVARSVLYNGAYFEVHIEVDGERGIIPVTWGMLRAHTPLVAEAYYARVYTARGWVSGRQAPHFGPTVILPEAFTPELTPTIFGDFGRAFMDWNRDFNGWTEDMTNAWMKAAVIHAVRAWTPELVGEAAVTAAAARARITGRMALGAAAVPGAAAATQACASGKCIPIASIEVLPRAGSIARSLGAGSRAEMIAKRVGLNIESPTSRQVLNSLDIKVTDFISQFRKAAIRRKFPSEFLERTVEEALLEGGSRVRKLLTDTRFVK